MPPQRRNQASPFNPWKWLSITMIASFVTYTLYVQLRQATGPIDLSISGSGQVVGEDGTIRDRLASIVARLKEAALINAASAELNATVEGQNAWAGDATTTAPVRATTNTQAATEKPPKPAHEKSAPAVTKPKDKETPKKPNTPKAEAKKPGKKDDKAASKDKTSTSKGNKGSKDKAGAVAIRTNVLQPVKGPLATNGSKPLWSMQHKGTDAIMALACKYPVQFYRRFVGTLRKAGYTEDIVLAVSPVIQMKPGVEAYLKEQEVVSYGFEVDCAGPDNCKLRDEFLGYPDPREHRTFANIRYALYEYWLQYYEPRSYVLILDFRDTFFQTNPMGEHLPFMQRTPKYDLRVFAENYKVKNIEKCVFNSMWVRKCFGHEAFESVKHLAVICSGSTYGSYYGITHYVQTMLNSMDTVQCWKKGIESDQGYQSYLFYTGQFNTPMGNATKYDQGEGVVNTIGAMNGFRVPKEMKGPLDTFWKIRDSDGFLLNNDGKRSSCVHQWDRFYDELQGFIDRKLLDPNTKLV